MLDVSGTKILGIGSSCPKSLRKKVSLKFFSNTFQPEAQWEFYNPVTFEYEPLPDYMSLIVGGCETDGLEFTGENPEGTTVRVKQNNMLILIKICFPYKMT